MLATVIRKYWLALVRDLLALGYRASDAFTTLSLSEMVAIVVGAPPQTSVRWYLDRGWSCGSHLLANMAEGQAGIATLQQPFPRPQIEQRQTAPGGQGFFQADAYTWEEFEAKQKQRYANAKPAPAGKTRVRTI
jgi:hypothetical protein